MIQYTWKAIDHPISKMQKILQSFNTITLCGSQCVSEPCKGRVSAELSKPVERKGAMCVVIV